MGAKILAIAPFYHVFFVLIKDNPADVDKNQDNFKHKTGNKKRL